MRVEEFCKKHNEEYRNYCEVVILPDGDIQYARPSHQLKLIFLEGVSENDFYDHCGKYSELMEKIPMEASPTHWMCEDLNIISCWFDACISPMSYTESQIKALQTLRKNRCISSDFNVEITIEKTLLESRGNISEEDLYKLFGKKSACAVKLKEIINE